MLTFFSKGLLFCLREQKFLELLEAGEDSRALIVLRKELEPLGYDVPRLHFLSGYVYIPAMTGRSYADSR